MTFGTKVNRFRERYGMSIHDLAKATGIRWEYLVHIETGKVENPAFITVIKIAKTFKMTASDFLEETPYEIMCGGRSDYK